MIEYALIFGLGFLAALLVGLLLAPAIHARIVKFTENRILATVPISPAELRAQKDMVRAEMAVQVARIGHDLKLEREKGAELTVSRDNIATEAARLRGEAADLANTIDELQVEAAELRSALRNEEIRREQLREAVAQADTGVVAWGNCNGIVPQRYDRRISEVLALLEGYSLHSVGRPTRATSTGSRKLCSTWSQPPSL